MLVVCDYSFNPITMLIIVILPHHDPLHSSSSDAFLPRTLVSPAGPKLLKERNYQAPVRLVARRHVADAGDFVPKRSVQVQTSFDKSPPGRRVQNGEGKGKGKTREPRSLERTELVAKNSEVQCMCR